jgi:predicted XRE-type DNA-binding protein
MIRENDRDDLVVHDSTGSVFEDLGLPFSQEDMLKIDIARAITATIIKRKLTQAGAGHIIGVDQAKISALLRGRLKGFSVSRLVIFLMKLGRDVDITISREHTNREGRLRVKSAAA